jgi:hypothetical protein
MMKTKKKKLQGDQKMVIIGFALAAFITCKKLY